MFYTKQQKITTTWDSLEFCCFIMFEKKSPMLINTFYYVICSIAINIFTTSKITLKYAMERQQQKTSKRIHQIN